MSGLHKTHSLVNIPFSWENQPGISKVTPHSDENNRIQSFAEEEELKLLKLKKALPLPLPLPLPLLLPLPPPPCKPENPKLSPHGIFVPLPPCAFQPPPQPQRAPEKKLSKKEAGPDDPFLAAYMECTKSRKQGKEVRKWNVWGRLEKLRFGFSCGCGGGVREDAMVRLSPVSNLPEERECDDDIIGRN